MWIILVCLLAGLVQLSTGFSSFTHIDKYLSGYQLRIVQVEDWFECIKHCKEEPLCISYNFDNKNECQLNRHGVEQRCQSEQQLLSRPGWIFHQIREVTTHDRVKERQGSCPCNCGTPKQCYVEPGFGEVPEKAAKSCLDIIKRRGSVPDGPYYLIGSSKPVYCHMTSLQGCGSEGGWTLVMKINGSKDTFQYDSKYWKVPSEEYQPENGGNLDEKETVLRTFISVTFLKICLGMRIANSSIHWLMKNRSDGITLDSRFRDNPGHEPFNYDVNTWLSLLPGSTLNGAGIKDGFNVEQTSGSGVSVRIGAIDDEDTPISYIGFGAGGDASEMHKGMTCGNVNGKKFIPAFGYILVR